MIFRENFKLTRALHYISLHGSFDLVWHNPIFGRLFASIKFDALGRIQTLGLCCLLRKSIPCYSKFGSDKKVYDLSSIGLNSLCLSGLMMVNPG